MIDQIGMFLILLVLWFGGRFIVRRWLWPAMARGRLTMRQAVFLNAGTFAVIPLLALPFVPSAWVILIATSIFIFVFELAISRLAVTFDKTNSAPKP